MVLFHSMCLSSANPFDFLLKMSFPIFVPGLKSPCKGFNFQTSGAAAAMIGAAEGDVGVDVVDVVDVVEGIEARFRDAGEG